MNMQEVEDSVTSETPIEYLDENDEWQPAFVTKARRNSPGIGKAILLLTRTGTSVTIWEDDFEDRLRLPGSSF